MIDFNKSLFENTRDNPLICAHRGFSAGNIPCNTTAAFRAALFGGADIIELDVTKSRDGELFVFHPGKESAHLGKKMPIRLLRSKAAERLHYINCDNVITHYTVEKLEDVLNFLRGKSYINVDKFWDDIPGITAVIRKCKVEKQVIVKTPINERYLKDIEKYASDLMFIPMISRTDEITDSLLKRNINYVGAETLFEHETDMVFTKEYAEEMHVKGLVLFRNSIVYDEKAIISAGLTDDRAVTGEKDETWGKLLDSGSDIIQTDFCVNLKEYLNSRSLNKNK